MIDSHTNILVGETCLIHSLESADPSACILFSAHPGGDLNFITIVPPKTRQDVLSSLSAGVVKTLNVYLNIMHENFTRFDNCVIFIGLKSVTSKCC